MVGGKISGSVSALNVFSTNDRLGCSLPEKKATSTLLKQ